MDESASISLYDDDLDPKRSSAQSDGIQSKRLQKMYDQRLGDTLYGWNSGLGGLGLTPAAGVGIVGMQYQGVRSPMFDDTHIFSDSLDPNALIEVGQDGRPVAQVAPTFNPAITVMGAGGVVGGGYEVVRPRGAAGAPGYDIVRDIPVGPPGYAPANPSLGLSAPPRQLERPWFASAIEGFPFPVLSLMGVPNIVMSVMRDWDSGGPKQISKADVVKGMEIDPAKTAVFRGGDTFDAGYDLSRGGLKIDPQTGNVRETHGLSLDIDPESKNVAPRGAFRLNPFRPNYA